jgi:hypothetical protein
MVLDASSPLLQIRDHNIEITAPVEPKPGEGRQSIDHSDAMMLRLLEFMKVSFARFTSGLQHFRTSGPADGPQAFMMLYHANPITLYRRASPMRPGFIGPTRLDVRASFSLPRVAPDGRDCGCYLAISVKPIDKGNQDALEY